MGVSELDISLGTSRGSSVMSSVDSTKFALLAGASQFKPGFESDRRKSVMTTSGGSSLGGSLSSIGFQSETMQQVIAGAEQFKSDYDKEKAVEALAAKVVGDAKLKAEMIAVVETEEEKQIQATRQALKAKDAKDAAAELKAKTEEEEAHRRLELIAEEEVRQLAETESSRELAEAEEATRLQGEHKAKVRA